jgi:hypothetical protein
MDQPLSSISAFNRRSYSLAAALTIGQKHISSLPDGGLCWRKRPTKNTSRLIALRWLVDEPDKNPVVPPSIPQRRPWPVVEAVNRLQAGAALMALQ